MLNLLRPNRVVASPSLLILFLLLQVYSTAAVAQQNPTSQSGNPGTTAAAAARARARRLSSSADEKPAAANDPAPEVSTSQADDPTRTLRDQIAAAKTPAEQTRLQLQLVDQLAAAGAKNEAVVELRAIIADDRFDPTAFYNMGNRLVQLGESEMAIRAYRKAIGQRNGNYSRALNNLGAVLLKLGRWDEAYDALSAALRQEKFHYAEASFNLGRLYAVRGETDLAIREWQRALAENPNHAGAAGALANVRSEGKIRVSGNPKRQSEPVALTNLGNPVRALGRTAKPLTVDRPTYELLQQARIARERGRDEEAVRYYRSVLSRTGGYFAPANLELSSSLMNLKRNDEALALLVPISTNDGNRYPLCYFYLARLYEARGELKLAEQYFGRASSAGYNAQFLLDLGRVREKVGDLPGALSALEQYVQGMESTGHKPDWSDERLAKLRQKITTSAATITNR